MTASTRNAATTRRTGNISAWILLVSLILASTTSLADHDHAPDLKGTFYSAARFGPDGRLWRVVPDKWHVYVDYSTDAGKTFSKPVRINSESQRIKTSSENRPDIIITQSGQIVIVYTAEGDQPATLYHSISTSHGHHFSAPAPVSSKATEANSSRGRLVLSPSGIYHIFWLDERDRTHWQQAGNAVYYTNSSEYNNTSGFTNHKLTDSTCECCRIDAAIDDKGQPALLTRFIYPGNIRDHSLLAIPPGNAPPLTWRATFDQWKIEGCPEHGPAISISKAGIWHITWFTQGEVRQGLFYARSSDHGKNFPTPVPLGNPDRLPSHPDVIAWEKQVVLAWTEYDGNKTQLMVRQSLDEGSTWLPDRAIAESSSRTDSPYLLSNPQGVFVSWNSKNEGYRLIPLN